jgi:uncharacterized OB-fold protein
MYQRSIAQRYRLAAQKCCVCGHVQFPPKGICLHCRTMGQFEPVVLSGRGVVYSFTTIHSGGAPPEFATQAAMRGPYSVAVIDLEEGPRIVAQLTYGSQVCTGMAVKAVFRRIYEEEGVIRYGLKFQPIRDGTEAT